MLLAGAKLETITGYVSPCWWWSFSLYLNFRLSRRPSPVALPTRLFKSAFRKRGFAPVVLSPTLAATATPTSALIP